MSLEFPTASYDNWVSREPSYGGSDCAHTCNQGHLMFEHETSDDEGIIVDACEKADSAQPLCETCAQWVWMLVDGISEAAESAMQEEAA